MSLRKFVILGVFSGVFAGTIIITPTLLKIHRNNVARKMDAEKAIINDLSVMKEILRTKQIKCLNKKYSGLETIHLKSIDLWFNLIGDTDKYRIIFGKKEKPEVVELSTKAVQFFESQESLLESCSVLSLEKLDPKKFSADIGDPLEKLLISEAQDLN